LNGWLLDTNVIASLSATDGAPSVKSWAGQIEESRLWLSVLTLAEYDKGIARLTDDDPSRGRFILARDALERRFSGRVLGLSDSVVRRWGDISGRVKRDTGHPPPVIDTMLAATAIEHRLVLVTRNLKDVAHSGAQIFSPWS